MVLYLVKMWAAIIGGMAFLCWPMVFFAQHPEDYMIWIPVMFGWPTFVLVTIDMAITKDMPAIYYPLPPPPPNL